MIVLIKPYGLFDMVYVGEPDLNNCKMCWFWNNSVHCPNEFPCHTEDGNIVFIKLEEKPLN